MPTDRIALEKAAGKYGEMLQAMRERAEARLAEVTAQDPRIGEIDREMRLTGLAAVRAALDGGADTLQARVRQTAERNLALQKERASRLEALGHPADYLYAGPFCPRCGDMGYVDGRICGCFAPFYEQELRAQFDEALGMGCPPFDEGLFARADAVDDPEAFLARCRQYAARLGSGAESLLLTGGTGRGKTMLAAYIAHEAIRQGTAVLYVTAQRYFALREEARFRRDEEAAEEADRYRDCPALVLDDLGLEAPSAGNAPELLALLNARAAAQRPMILCTSLRADKLAERYSGAAASRIENGFRTVELRSGDLRRVFRPAAF